MDDPSCGEQATLHHVSASPHRRSRAGAHDTRDGTFANPGIPLNLTHCKTGIVQSNNNGIALRRRCSFNPVERNPETLRHLVGKGEEVHVGWNGIHVANERKGEEVHVGPGGLHIDTLEDDGHSVHTNDDGTVTIDGETFSSWKEAHDKLDHHGKHFHTKVGRTWNKFPFPALVALAYLVLGIVYGTWATGLFLVFLIPVYYALGDLIDQRHLSKLIDVVYSVSAEAWFLYMWLCLGQPHPAWVILITIPVVKALMRWCRKQWKHRKRA